MSDPESDSGERDQRPAAKEAAAIADADVDIRDGSTSGGTEDSTSPEIPPQSGMESNVEIRDGSEDADLDYPYEREPEVDGVTLSSWGQLFPYDEPYDDQKDAISKILGQLDHDQFEEGGFSLLEAACGTGKTLIALCAAIAAIRDPDTEYERLMVSTSVHQQLRAFEDDLEAINENLPDDVDPISGISMVGKANLCAYTESGDIDDGAIYNTCDQLRNPVKLLSQTDTAEGSLEELVKGAETSVASPMDQLETDDWTSPYHDGFPTTGEDTEFCPFYAEYRRQKAADEGEYAPSGVVRPSELMERGAEQGVCPHAVLLESILNSEIIIGNYKHIFDPVTVESMTGELIGNETILVADEAHNLVPEARDELSDEVAHTTIADAIDEIRNVILELEGDAGQQMQNELSLARVDDDDLRDYADFLEDLLLEIQQRTVDKLDELNPQWHEEPWKLPDEIEISLRDPEEVERDSLTEWIVENGYAEQLDHSGKIESGVSNGFDEAQADSDFQKLETYTDTVARVLNRWWITDHEEYFRQLNLTQLSHERNGEMAFESHFTASLELQNCIPADEIADRLDKFGAGVLMSATLEPMDVYEETVGAGVLREEGRDVQSLTYGLSYPRENRYSAAVPTTKFTSGKRGSPNYNNSVREEYIDTVQTVATSTPGNVMVSMPSYAEAEWIAEQLSDSPAVDKPVRPDGSDVDTEELKEWFFGEDDKILATGVRGTLTEGVDFDGQKLAACIVCGVPLRDLRGDHATAIQTAYEGRYGRSNGFEYAFTVPAIRKARQSLGRVIRGSEEVGARVLADRRYAQDSEWDDVREHFPDYDKEEYQKTRLLGEELSVFWDRHE